MGNFLKLTYQNGQALLIRKDTIYLVDKEDEDDDCTRVCFERAGDTSEYYVQESVEQIQALLGEAPAALGPYATLHAQPKNGTAGEPVAPPNSLLTQDPQWLHHK